MNRTTPVSVLIVEDESGIREGLGTAVETLRLRPLLAAGLTDARRALASIAGTNTIDCVLLDIRLKDGDGLDFLRELRAGPHADVPVIITTAYGDSERTIRAMRDGAFDYLTKPFHLPTLLATIERAVRQRALAQELAAPEPIAQPPRQGGLVGSSAAMLGIWKLIGRAAASDAPVLVTGETGTGKELVARAIHSFSNRQASPFLPVNLAALPETLLESELFGHEKGSFTGAANKRQGRFELAAGGTLFLDEIGDLSVGLQTKLLRVLQDGSYERVGGNEALVAHARLVSATSKSVKPGSPGCVLREDLYYRLSVLEIEVPPLRARRSDIPLLVAHALRDTPARAVSEEAMAALLDYRWPGNVRELVHVIQRAAALCGGEIIDLPNLPAQLTSPDSQAAGLSGFPRAPGDDGPPAAEPATLSLRDAVAQLERRMIERALLRANGNRSEAARQLGIGRPQLYAKMDEHGIGGRGGEPPSGG